MAYKYIGNYIEYSLNKLSEEEYNFSYLQYETFKKNDYYRNKYISSLYLYSQDKDTIKSLIASDINSNFKGSDKLIYQKYFDINLNLIKYLRSLLDYKKTNNFFIDLKNKNKLFKKIEKIIFKTNNYKEIVKNNPINLVIEIRFKIIDLITKAEKINLYRLKYKKINKKKFIEEILGKRNFKNEIKIEFNNPFCMTLVLAEKDFSSYHEEGSDAVLINRDNIDLILLKKYKIKNINKIIENNLQHEYNHLLAELFPTSCSLNWPQTYFKNKEYNIRIHKKSAEQNMHFFIKLAKDEIISFFISNVINKQYFYLSEYCLNLELFFKNFQEIQKLISSAKISKIKKINLFKIYFKAYIKGVKKISKYHLKITAFFYSYIKKDITNINKVYNFCNNAIVTPIDKIDKLSKNKHFNYNSKILNKIKLKKQNKLSRDDILFLGYLGNYKHLNIILNQFNYIKEKNNLFIFNDISWALRCIIANNIDKFTQQDLNKIYKENKKLRIFLKYLKRYLNLK